MILAALAAPINERVPPFSPGGAFLRYPDQQELRIVLEGEDGQGLWIGPRGILEADQRFRQILPYVVLKVGDKFVKYDRQPSGGEARLHGLASIGFGGHIEAEDVIFDHQTSRVKLMQTIMQNATRELREELSFTRGVGFRSEWAGVLVDMSNDVGLVHVGVVGFWHLAAMPESNEDDIGGLELLSLEELHARRDQLESWSQLIVDDLYGAALPPA
jgi:predicted NUDIX family phosphoesterase